MLKIIRDGWTRCHSTRVYIQQKSIRNIGTDLQKEIEKIPRIRPLNQPPKVWQLIEKIRKDGKLIRFTIQEIPEDRYEEVIQQMCTHFIPEEPMCLSLNMKNDPLLVQDLSTLWRLVLTQGISIGAFVDNLNDGKPIIVGMNILGVHFKDKKDSISDSQFKFEAVKKIKDVIINYLSKVVYESYGVDKCLYGSGIYVDPNHRGYGLSKYMLKTRDLMGFMYGIPVIALTSSSTIVEKLAVDGGFEELLTKNFSDFVTKDGNEYFPNINCKAFKIMGKRLF